MNMKYKFIIADVLAISGALVFAETAQPVKPSMQSSAKTAFVAAGGDYPYKAAGLRDVTVTGGFWLPRVETNRLVTLKTDFEKCELQRIPNFRRAAAYKWGTFKGIPFDDSDVYKVIEGAAEILATHPDAELEKYVDSVIDDIAAAQEPDGYLYTARTLGFTYKNKKTGATEFRMMGPVRWSHLAHSHELYNVGHLYEAAVAYYEATGKRKLLDVAIKSADLIDRTFGEGPTQLKGTSGHEEIELALCKLYRVTGEERYLKLAKFFLDRRGAGAKDKSGAVFTQSGDLADGASLAVKGAYMQDHLPVTEQREAVGHAVRATYLYCGMADVAALAGNEAYMKAIGAIWQNVVSKKLHINGSVGARRKGEAFGANYELPNETAYLETCAGIGNALWNQRMFQMYGDAKYVDVLELALYNGIISGVSLSGNEFFYPNPLASHGGYKRSKWFGCSCCPVNVVRFLPQVALFAYATRGDAVYVNLFIESDATMHLPCGDVKLVQKTDYPWSGKVRITVAPPKDGARFAVNVRVPGWCTGRVVPSDLYTQTIPGTPDCFVLKVNGKAVAANPVKGYVTVEREWKSGDTVDVVMDMPVRRVKAHEKVETNRDRLAVMRGPVLYCAEGLDNDGTVLNAVIPSDVTFEDGSVDFGGQVIPSLKSSNGVKLVPYFAWGNRQPGGEMQTWFRLVSAPVELTSSYCNPGDSIQAMVDGILPSSSNDESIPRFTFWPHKGTREWVQFVFNSPKEICRVEAYWFDDTGKGKCRVPASWSVQWRGAGDTSWREIRAEGPVSKDGFCAIDFPKGAVPKVVRINIQLQKDYSAGLLECRFK